MYPYYQVLKDDFKLPYDDTVGIQQLYGKSVPRQTYYEDLAQCICF